MRHFDLTPLYRSTIGFDRLGSLLDTLGAFEGDTPSYPPYNIERVGENEYRISMAIAGFGMIILLSRRGFDAERIVAEKDVADASDQHVHWRCSMRSTSSGAK